MGKFAWGVNAKHCWALSTNFENKKCVDITQQCFAFTPLVNFPANNLNFHWRWRRWNQIQTIFWNLFYFIKVQIRPKYSQYLVNAKHKVWRDRWPLQQQCRSWNWVPKQKNILPFLDENSEKITRRRFRQYICRWCVAVRTPLKLRNSMWSVHNNLQSSCTFRGKYSGK